MPEQALTARQLNRSLLARQHLLARTGRPLTRVLEDVGGIQMQYAPSGYIGCWTRMRDLRRDRVSRALARRQIVQATLQRSTIHLTTPADYVAMTAGTQPARQRWWLQTAGSRGLAAIDHDAVAAVVRTWFADGPLTRAQVLDRLAAEGIDRAHWEGLVQWLDVLRLPPQGTWERRRAHLFGLAALELPDVPPVTREAGLRRLVVRGLGGFGPLTAPDLATWAGVPVADLEPALAALPLRRFRAAEDGAVLLDLPRRPLPDGDVPAPVRLLPTWDAVLLVHCRRTGLLPEVHRSAVFSTRNPHSVGTVLVDGRVVAAWRPSPTGIDVEPFEDIPPSAMAEVRAEAAALAAFSA